MRESQLWSKSEEKESIQRKWKMLQKEFVNNGAEPQKRWGWIKRSFSQTEITEVKIGDGIVWCGGYKRKFERAYFI